MSVRDTSAYALQQLRNDLQLGDRQRLVLDLIRDWPDSTDAELTKLLVKFHGGSPDPNRIRPRRTELVKRGLVNASGKRRCSVTGRLAYTWRVVTHDPQGRLF